MAGPRQGSTPFSVKPSLTLLDKSEYLSPELPVPLGFSRLVQLLPHLRADLCTGKDTGPLRASFPLCPLPDPKPVGQCRPLKEPGGGVNGHREPSVSVPRRPVTWMLRLWDSRWGKVMFL